MRNNDGKFREDGGSAKSIVLVRLIHHANYLVEVIISRASKNAILFYDTEKVNLYEK